MVSQLTSQEERIASIALTLLHMCMYVRQGGGSALTGQVVWVLCALDDTSALSINDNCTLSCVFADVDISADQ